MNLHGWNLTIVCRDKVANHLALLQPKKNLATNDIGSPAYTRFMKDLEFAKVAFPPDVVGKLPGTSLVRKDGIMDNHFDLSGKLKVLDSLLEGFQREENNKTLVFSYSTQTLDLIQNYVRSKGLSFLRMDGTTNHTKRQEIADTFNSDPNVFLLLLSTKAMGLGLNLTVRKGSCLSMSVPLLVLTTKFSLNDLHSCHPVRKQGGYM
jgi:SNF2 family DNA or RNA helicase